MVPCSWASVVSTIGASILAEGLLASAETGNTLCIVVIRWRKLIACAGRGGQGGPGGLGTAAGKGEGVDTCGCHAPSVTSPSAARSRPALRGKCSGFVMDRRARRGRWAGDHGVRAVALAAALVGGHAGQQPRAGPRERWIADGRPLARGKGESGRLFERCEPFNYTLYDPSFSLCVRRATACHHPCWPRRPRSDGRPGVPPRRSARTCARPEHPAWPGPARQTKSARLAEKGRRALIQHGWRLGPHVALVRMDRAHTRGNPGR